MEILPVAVAQVGCVGTKTGDAGVSKGIFRVIVETGETHPAKFCAVTVWVDPAANPE